MTKACTKCGEIKDVSLFFKDASSKSGFTYQCKDCIKAVQFLSRDKTKIYKKEWSKVYHLNNQEKNRKKSSLWAKNNKERLNARQRAYQTHKRKTDPIWRCAKNIRNLVGGTFSRACEGRFKKKSRTAEILGCTLDEFRLHIESQFTPGMSWEIRGQIHIDHIIPICSAKTEEELLRLNHFSNLRPLWAWENQSKGGRYSA